MVRENHVEVGCDGARKSRRDWRAMVRENYGWRVERHSVANPRLGGVRKRHSAERRWSWRTTVRWTGAGTN